EADHSRPEPALHHLANGIGSARDVVELEATKDGDLGGATDSQTSRGNDAEGAFASDDELGPVGAAPGSGELVGLNHLAGAGDEGETDDQVFDLPVLGRELTCGST